MKDFNDEVCVITGAGSGIGRALALELAGHGARLALSDINAQSATATAEACRALGARAVGYGVDVSDRDAFAANVDEVLSEFGRVNLVVNNAGVAMHSDFVETSWEDWEWLMGINFGGLVNGTKLYLPPLIASGDGYLVNVSSVFGLVGVPGQSAYNASKFAVRGLTEAVAQEMANAGHPVRVSCVHPGGIKTNIANAARTQPGVEIAGVFERAARTTPQAAARTILSGVQRERLRILVGPDAHAFEAMERLLGSRYTGLVRRAMRTAMKTTTRPGSSTTP